MQQNEDEQDKVNEQIEVINVDNKDISIIEEFFDFVLLERDQETLFIEQAYSHSTIQQSDAESDEWSIDDIMKN
ncbi:28071_t:CDS:2 [Racocetra persica]|uniref:28071_t:CDS:1 n=1 Tax=Racocetra persica TaxID=160502 RepID=A0ACA9KG40_9GLOM|nr:28071_t:CDS:2 [Racocetra persica]